MASFFGRNFATGLLIGCIVAVGVAAAAITYERYDTKTLKRTVRRDAVYCGVNTGLPGFSAQDDKGNWAGFDGNLDGFTIGLDGVDTTVDFEPEPQCTTTCYVSSTSGDDTFGGGGSAGI